jgi:ATP/maltotriose-dependent transcriptional regulator MalT
MAIYEPERHHRQLTSILADDSGVTAMAMLGWALHWLGDIDGSIATTERAVAMAVALDDPYSIVQATLWRAFLMVERGEPRAIEEGEVLVRLTEEQHIPAFTAAARMFVGRARRDAAEVMAAAAMGGSAGTMVMAPQVFLSLAIANRAAGLLDDAVAIADMGIDIAQATGQHSTDVQLRSLKAESLMDQAIERPDKEALLDQADALSSRALEQARDQSANTSVLIAATTRARLLVHRGRVDEAIDLLDVHGAPFASMKGIGFVDDARSLRAALVSGQ